MQKLSTLWQFLDAASTVRDIAQHKKTYHFAVTGPLTFYLQSESADVEIVRWSRPMIEVEANLQGAFGWRIATEQDEAGVYIAARRRVVVGSLSSVRFTVRLPHDTYLILKLTPGSVRLVNVDETLHITPNGEIRSAG